jgi:hypothetical protein
MPTRRSETQFLVNPPGVGAPCGAPVRRRPHLPLAPRAALVKAAEGARAAGRSEAQSLDQGEHGATLSPSDGERRAFRARIVTEPRLLLPTDR